MEQENKLPTAEEFLDAQESYTRNLSVLPLGTSKIIKQNMIEFAKLCVIAELKKHIEHPTKPGYKRSDIIARIKELERNRYE